MHGFPPFFHPADITYVSVDVSALDAAPVRTDSCVVGGRGSWMPTSCVWHRCPQVCREEWTAAWLVAREDFLRELAAAWGVKEECHFVGWRRAGQSRPSDSRLEWDILRAGERVSLLRKGDLAGIGASERERDWVTTVPCCVQESQLCSESCEEPPEGLKKRRDWLVQSIIFWNLVWAPVEKVLEAGYTRGWPGCWRMGRRRTAVVGEAKVMEYVFEAVPVAPVVSRAHSLVNRLCIL